MAINRVDYPTDLTSQSDFSDHGELIETRFMDQSAAPIQVRDGVIPRGVVLQIGGVVYRANSDETISGTETNYVKVTPSGSTATAEYVTDLTGVSWSAQYNGYYDSSGNLYLFDEGIANSDGELTGFNTSRPRLIPEMKIYTSSGTFTVPDGVSRVKATVVGGGGGGGGADVGLGDDGGTSSFATISATGGDGGAQGETSTFAAFGGIGSGGDINMQGTSGGRGGYFPGLGQVGVGEGGSSFFGGGAPTKFGSGGSSEEGQDSGPYGGGGSGAVDQERAGGGGAGGGCAIGFISVTSGESITVTVGSGGAGVDFITPRGGNGSDGVVVIEY